MAERIFDKETMLDLSVNIIPLFIILFFIVTLPLFNTWGWELMPTVVTLGLHVVPLVSLAVLTYVSGKIITADERNAETNPQSRSLTEEEADEGREGRSLQGDAPSQHPDANDEGT